MKRIHFKGNTFKCPLDEKHYPIVIPQVCQRCEYYKRIDVNGGFVVCSADECILEWPSNAKSPSEYAHIYKGEFDWLKDTKTFEEAIDSLEAGLSETRGDLKNWSQSIERSKSLIHEFQDLIERGRE